MNQYSRWALDVGVVHGETVALMMGKSARGILRSGLVSFKVGAIAALVSPSLGASALRRALNVAGARRVIAAASCADLCAEAIAGLDRVELWTLRPRSSGGPTNRPCDFDVERRTAREGERPPVTLADRALRIFTSGTNRSEQSRRNQSPQAYTLDALVCRARRHDCGKIGFIIACRCITALAASSPSAHRWSSAVRSSSLSASRRTAFGTT